MSEEDNQSSFPQSAQDRRDLLSQSQTAAVGGGHDVVNLAPSSTPGLRTPSPAGGSQSDRSSTVGRLRVASIVPTQRSATNSPVLPQDTAEELDYNNSSGDESGSDRDDDGPQDHDPRNGDHFERRARQHRSFRLNTVEGSEQRQAARIIPNRYASIRLRTSKVHMNNDNNVQL